MVNEGKLTMGHARALVSAENPKALAQKIISAGLSVRQIEALVSGGGSLKKGPGATGKRKDSDTVALEKDLKAALGGMKVTINHEGTDGNVVIRYKDLEELDSLCSKLGVCGF